MESVKLIECPRDAWQGLPRQIPTERKVEYLRALIAAGFRHIDAVSFVSPKAVPQMADSEEVLTQLGRADGVEIIGIVVNEKGAERAIATRAVTTLGFPYSISETFLARNQKQTPERNLAVLRQVVERARDAGLKTVAYISMAFGNPYSDAWSEERVAEAAEMLAVIGVGAVSLADTIGSATPALIASVFSAAPRSIEVGVHLHSRRDDAAEKVLAAYESGCRRFDSALGGLGGCPFAQDDLVGNIPTEEVLRALEQRGITALPAVDRLLPLSASIAHEFASAGGE